jgi:hypothetical protein
MSDEMAGVVPDEGFWNRLAQSRGPGYAASIKSKWESEQAGKGPLADVSPTIAPEIAAQAPAPAAPAPPEALAAPAPNEMTPTPLGTAPAPVADPVPAFEAPGPKTTQTKDQHTEIERGHVMDPAKKAEFDAAQMAQVGALEHKNEIVQQEATKIADIEQKRAAEEAAANKIALDRAAERKKINDQYMGQVQAAQKALDADKGPPEESLGTQVKNRIALALGALGAGLSGGPNHAAGIIQADRAETMNKWKAEYERKKGKVTGSQNLYALARNQGLDDEAAEALAAKQRNAQYEALIRATKAEYSAPMTKAQADAELERLKQDNLLRDDAISRAAENKVRTTVDQKTVTQEGGADIKTKKDLMEMADKDEFVKRARESSRALAKFNDLVKSGADGAAVAEFIAGKGGLEQGSFGPGFVQMLKKRSVFGQGIEKLRETFKGGVDPELLKDLRNGLAAEYGTALVKGKPSITHFRREYQRAGIDPHMVTGGETSTEAAADAGAVPSAYQGRQ